MAVADISLGQRLTPEMFKLAEWPADSVPKGAFTDPQKLGGRVLKSTLLMGEPVSETKLAPSGTLRRTVGPDRRRQARHHRAGE